MSAPGCGGPLLLPLLSAVEISVAADSTGTIEVTGVLIYHVITASFVWKSLPGMNSISS